MAENIFKLSYTADEINAKLGKIPDNWNAVADQTYDANSTNAQSGKAVASGISQAITEAKEPIITTAVNDAVKKVQNEVIPSFSNNAINKAVDQAVSKVNTEIVPSVLATAEATIKEKIEVETIPEVKQEVLNETKALFANAIRGSKDGTYVLIEDASNIGQDIGVKVINNSKNLIHAKMAIETVLDAYRGIKLDPNAFPYTLSISLKNGKDIANLPSDIYFGIVYKNTGAAKSALWIIESGAYKTPENLYRNTEALRAFELDEVAVAVYADSNIENAWSTIFEYFDVQLEHSLEPTAYQQAVHFPDVKVTICGKNLFKESEVGPPSSGLDEAHKLVANLTSNIIISAEKSNDLTFNFDTTDSNAPWRIQVKYADGTFSYCKDRNFVGEFGCSYVCPATQENPITEINFRSYGITAGCYKNIQVEFGSEATDYESYLNGGTFPADENGNAIVTTNLTNILLHTDKPHTSLEVSYIKDTTTAIQHCVIDNLDYNNLKNNPLTTHREIDRDIIPYQTMYAERADLLNNDHVLEFIRISVDNFLALFSENTLYIAGPLKMLLDGNTYDLNFKIDSLFGDTPFCGNPAVAYPPLANTEVDTGDTFCAIFVDDTLAVITPHTESGNHIINIYYQNDHAWVLPEKTYTFTSDDILGFGLKGVSYSVAQVLAGPFENNLYRLSLDNNSYEFFWTRTDLLGNAEVYIAGNQSFLNPVLENTGEPFVLGYIKAQNLFVVATASTSADTHVMSLEKLLSTKMVYDRLDDGYLAYTEDTNTKDVTFISDVKGYNGFISLGQLQRDLTAFKNDVKNDKDNTPTLVEGFEYESSDQLTKGLSANRNTLPTAVGTWIEGGGALPFNMVPGQLGYKPTNTGTTYQISNGAFECLYRATSTAEEVRNKISDEAVIKFVIASSGETFYRRVTSCQINNKYVVVNTASLSSSGYPDVPASLGDYTGGIAINSVVVYPKTGRYSHIEGYKTMAMHDYSHAEGYETKASGFGAHAEGYATSTLETTYGTHAEGYYTKASGQGAHAEGSYTTASFEGAHAEGYYTEASGQSAHAEGSHTAAKSTDAHAEGYRTTASYSYAHAEGSYTEAKEESAHAEGHNTEASGKYSHAEGSHTTASGVASHAGGIQTIAAGKHSTVIGRANIEDLANKYSFIIGNGILSGTTDVSSRSNAHTVDWNGNAWYAGSIEAVDGIILKSTTEGSTKKFKITVDDTGILTTTEYVEVATTEVEEIIEE